jgi:hypothetical protein
MRVHTVCVVQSQYAVYEFYLQPGDWSVRFVEYWSELQSRGPVRSEHVRSSDWVRCCIEASERDSGAMQRQLAVHDRHLRQQRMRVHTVCVVQSQYAVYEFYLQPGDWSVRFVEYWSELQPRQHVSDECVRSSDWVRHHAKAGQCYCDVVQ